MKSVDILIPNWHCLEAIELAVESIRAYTNPSHYKLIVHDDAIPRKKGFTYRNRDYLRECAKNDWLELIESKKNQGHGKSLDILFKRCDSDIAVVLDCDVQILKSGWLQKLVSLFKTRRDLMFCNTEKVHTEKPSLTTWFNPWFLALNMRAYRKDMKVSWAADTIDGVWWNVGARLLKKVREDNPKRYRIQPIPEDLKPYYFHHVHTSCVSVISDWDTENYKATHHAKFKKIREELTKIRNERGWYFNPKP